MEDRIKMLLELLPGSSYARFQEVMSGYSISELEGIAIELEPFHDDNRRNPRRELLDRIMSARRNCLNSAFVYTPESVSKLLYLNDRIIECWEKLRRESVVEDRAMSKRLSEGDAYLHDYYIECKIKAYIGIELEDGDIGEAFEGIDGLLNLTLPEFILSASVREGDWKNSLYMNRDLNWDLCDGLSHGELGDVYIGYGIHELYDHTYLSLPDILRINLLRCEVMTTRQHFVKWNCDNQK
jgi:hypothetical protein